MTLLELRCSDTRFKTLRFNKGLNIVAGLQLSSSGKQTYNGIGKSLSLDLLHMMLGSKIENNKTTAFIKNYGTFTLELEHKNNKYIIQKDFNDDYYQLNGSKYTYGKYLKQLDNIFIPKEIPLSFRQVFKAFARKYGGTNYSDALMQQGTAISEYNQRFVNFVLLGIETNLVKERFQTKEQMAKIDDAEKVIKKFEENTDEVNIRDTEEELEKLNELKTNFQISENYNAQQQNADVLTDLLNNERNILYDLESRHNRKSNAVEQQVFNETDYSVIFRIYNEAKVIFSDLMVKTIVEVQDFHKSIINNRKNKLEKEIKVLTAEIEVVKNKISQIGNERDNILRVIEGKGALSEYYALLEKIKFLEDKKNEALKYKDMLLSLKKDRSSLEVTNSIIKNKSILYIDQSLKEFEKKEAKFRSLVKRFYANTGGSLEITETQDAKYLYDIKIEIPKQNSQGVGEVKIFCYDLLLYSLNSDLLGFLAHDGCIFSEMDPRQKAMIIKCIIDEISKGKLQYFVNMNQNTYDEILSSTVFSKQEKELIEKSVILKLFDKDPKNWLLGESF